MQAVWQKLRNRFPAGTQSFVLLSVFSHGAPAWLLSELSGVIRANRLAIRAN